MQEKINELIGKSCELRCVKNYDDEYGTHILEVRGGKNGAGNWTEYFEDLGRFTKILESNGFKVWLVKTWIDCLDDVWTFSFGYVKEKIHE